MYRIKNTADDRSKHLLHRQATKFELEPSIGGKRIRLGSHLDIDDDHYARVKHMIDNWVSKGIVEVTKLDVDPAKKDEPKTNAEGLKLGGPTLEEWIKAGYSPEKYPPEGFAEVFSPGLVAFKREREEAIKKDAEAAAQAIKEAPSILPVPVIAVVDKAPPTVPAPVPEETMQPIAEVAPVTQPVPSPVKKDEKKKGLR